jgi:hypothetical protein
MPKSSGGVDGEPVRMWIVRRRLGSQVQDASSVEKTSGVSVAKDPAHCRVTGRLRGRWRRRIVHRSVVTTALHGRKLVVRTRSPAA